MSYHPVTPHTDKTNGSKANEGGTTRDNFNKAYQTITYGKSNAYDLTYETSQHESKLLYRKDKNTKEYQYGYKGQKFPVNGIDEQYIIKANTKNAYNQGYLDKIMTPEEIRKKAKEEVTDINLGLKEREQPDLALVKDLETAKVSINGQTHVYQYGDRFNPDLFAENGGDSGYNLSPQVKFESKYASMSYTRALYASDVYYEGNKELSVKVIYKIGIKNVSYNLTSVVNEIEDYYDNKYTNDQIVVGTQIDTTSWNIKNELDSRFIEQLDSGNSEYRKIRIKHPLELQPQEEKSIYVELEVQRDQIVAIIESQNNEREKLDNIAEITSYSTKDANGKVYAGVDQDSQPGNLRIDQPATYEDDTDKAPGLQLVLQDERKVQGSVFLDNTTDELKTGQIREGNGIYDENETGIKGVIVSLIDSNTQKLQQVYKNEEWVDAVTETNENGEFDLGGFIPGEYILQYTWGDKTYKVQDYKGTIYKEPERKDSPDWYKNTTTRYSDAVDNYDTREKIDRQTEIVTNANKKVINEYEGEILLEDGTKEELITTMDSSTPMFKVNLEYNTGLTNARDEYELNPDGSIKMEGSYIVKKEGYKNHLQNIDFGIVERARQVLRLHKNIQSVKVSLSNGNILINAEVDEDGKLKDTVKYATHIPKSSGANGQFKIEIDSEIIQGAKLEVKYQLKAENISELDYLDENYYKYGSGYGQRDDNLVSLTAKEIVDYLDNNIVIDKEQGNVWNVVEGKTLINDGLLEDTTEMKNLFGSNFVMTTEGLSEEALRPTGTTGKTQTAVSLTGYKLLSNVASEEIAFDNEAEIIRIEKSGGASITTIPGNYDPSIGVQEEDEAQSETVFVVPPTGLNTDYIAYTLLAISSLGILISGIILIKKFVMR